MYSLVNDLESRVIANLSSDSELIDKVRLIAIEDKDRIAPIDSVTDCFEYINEYTENLFLVLDSEVEQFLDMYGIEVEVNEPSAYIDLMMDNHKCIEWKGKQYYISDSLDLTDYEENIYDVLVYSLHV
jgi:hypothetical protein